MFINSDNYVLGLEQKLRRNSFKQHITSGPRYRHSVQAGARKLSILSRPKRMDSDPPFMGSRWSPRSALVGILVFLWPLSLFSTGVKGTHYKWPVHLIFDDSPISDLNSSLIFVHRETASTPPFLAALRWLRVHSAFVLHKSLRRTSAQKEPWRVGEEQGVLHLLHHSIDALESSPSRSPSAQLRH